MTNTMQATRQGSPVSTTQPPNGAELRDQIKQSILAAQDAAREAAMDGAAVHAPRGAHVIRFGQNGGMSPGGLPSGIVYGTGSSNNDNGFPPQVVDISIAFFIMCAVMVIGWPLARAFGRRLERRPDVPSVGAGMTEQLQRIEQAVDAMAIEIERISESQRFIAKLQNAQLPSRELTSS